MDTVIQFRGTIYENGYGLIAQKVMRDKDLSPVAKSIYAYICSFAGADKDGERSAFPGVELMMVELGIKTDDTYYKHRKQLLDKGYLTIEKNRKVGKFDNNIYFVEAVPAPKNVDTKGKEPDPKKSGMESPHPKKSSTVKSSTIKKGTTITSSTITSSYNLEEEEEKVSPSELISFLLTKDITLENAQKFETRLLEKNITGYTNEDTLEALTRSFNDFNNNICDEPYLWAVGKLERILDSKTKGKVEKPVRKQKKPTRTELLPDWYESSEEREQQDAKFNELLKDKMESERKNKKEMSPEQISEAKQEIDDMLKKLRA